MQWTLLDITRAHEHNLKGRTYGGSFLRRMIHTSIEQGTHSFNFFEKKRGDQASLIGMCIFCALWVTTR